MGVRAVRVWSKFGGDHVMDARGRWEGGGGWRRQLRGLHLPWLDPRCRMPIAVAARVAAVHDARWQRRHRLIDARTDGWNSTYRGSILEQTRAPTVARISFLLLTGDCGQYCRGGQGCVIASRVARRSLNAASGGSLLGPVLMSQLVQMQVAAIRCDGRQSCRTGAGLRSSKNQTISKGPRAKSRDIWNRKRPRVLNICSIAMSVAGNSMVQIRSGVSREAVGETTKQKDGAATAGSGMQKLNSRR